jgi:hypothetical protein
MSAKKVRVLDSSVKGFLVMILSVASLDRLFMKSKPGKSGRDDLKRRPAVVMPKLHT